MRIIVISDTHGNYGALSSVFLRNSDADWFIHLGDGEHDLDRFITEHPEYAPKVLHASGNCDVGSLSPSYVVLPLIGGHRIFATHGHVFGVKGGLERLKLRAAEMDCDIVLYGHTHIRFSSYENGLYVMNPGSASCPHDGTKPSFGTIDVSDAGVLLNIADV